MKSEARNPKSETNPKFKYQMFKTVLGEYMDSPLQADITTVGVDPCINPGYKEFVSNFGFKYFARKWQNLTCEIMEIMGTGAYGYIFVLI